LIGFIAWLPRADPCITDYHATRLADWTEVTRSDKTGEIVCYYPLHRNQL
jgi:hypothetical protein